MMFFGLSGLGDPCFDCMSTCDYDTSSAAGQAAQTECVTGCQPACGPNAVPVSSLPPDTSVETTPPNAILPAGVTCNASGQCVDMNGKPWPAPASIPFWPFAPWSAWLALGLAGIGVGLLVNTWSR